MLKSLIRFHSASKIDNYSREGEKVKKKKRERERKKKSIEQVKT